MKTQITLAKFITDYGISVRFVPLHAAQDQESQFKTWRLHYTALVSVGVGGRAESFSWMCGYGCALNDTTRANLKEAARRAPGRTFCAPSIRGLETTVVEYICKHGEPNRLADQKAVGVVMAWLLANYIPDAESLVNSLKLDACLGENSFHDFCGEIGMDEDSRKAEASWRACQENGRKLRSVIGVKAFAELLENTESL